MPWFDKTIAICFYFIKKIYIIEVKNKLLTRITHMPNNVCAEPTYKAIFNKISESLRNFIYYKSGDLSMAEDITQEAFLRLWKECVKVSSDKAKSFLFTVANNLLKDHFKHQKVVLQFEKRDLKSVDYETPEYNYVKDEFHSALEKAISNLPEKSREVFLMNRIDKLTYSDIAESLSISKKAVEKRMHKALVELKKITDNI